MLIAPATWEGVLPISCLLCPYLTSVSSSPAERAHTVPSPFMSQPLIFLRRLPDETVSNNKDGEVDIMSTCSLWGLWCAPAAASCLRLRAFINCFLIVLSTGRNLGTKHAALGEWGKTSQNMTNIEEYVSCCLSKWWWGVLRMGVLCFFVLVWLFQI